jgi:hypothetical protein
MKENYLRNICGAFILEIKNCLIIVEIGNTALVESRTPSSIEQVVISWLFIFALFFLHVCVDGWTIWIIWGNTEFSQSLYM